MDHWVIYSHDDDQNICGRLIKRVKYNTNKDKE